MHAGDITVLGTFSKPVPCFHQVFFTPDSVSVMHRHDVHASGLALFRCFFCPVKNLFVVPLDTESVEVKAGHMQLRFRVTGVRFIDDVLNRLRRLERILRGIRFLRGGTAQQANHEATDGEVQFHGLAAG